jgi:hypothetical protein
MLSYDRPPPVPFLPPEYAKIMEGAPLTELEKRQMVAEIRQIARFFVEYHLGTTEQMVDGL